MGQDFRLKSPLPVPRFYGSLVHGFSGCVERRAEWARQLVFAASALHRTDVRSKAIPVNYNGQCSCGTTGTNSMRLRTDRFASESRIEEKGSCRTPARQPIKRMMHTRGRRLSHRAARVRSPSRVPFQQRTGLTIISNHDA